MAKFACELCGSDIVKEGAAFVCRGCGMQYDIEAVRKMMASDMPVDAASAAPVVPAAPAVNEKLEKMLVLARRARKEDNGSEAKKYYEQALAEAPDDWESGFYCAYYQLQEDYKADLDAAYANFSKRICSILQIIQEKCPEEGWQEAMDDFMGGVARAHSLLAIWIKQAHADLTIQIGEHLLSGFVTPSRNPADSYIFEVRLNNMHSKRHGLHGLGRTIRKNLLELCDAAAKHPERPAPQGKITEAWDSCEALFEVDAMEYTQYLNLNCKAFIEEIFAFEDMRRAQDKAFESKAIAILRKAAAEDKGKAEVYRIAAACLKERDAQQQVLRAEAYWAAHPEEKQALLDTQEAIRAKLAELEAREKRLRGNDSETELSAQVDELAARRDKLGLFKLKEKKAMQEQIDEIMGRLQKLRDEKRAALRDTQYEIYSEREKIREIDRKIARGGE